MADIIQLRGGTAAAWAAANPILADRETGVETDTRKMKLGDGLTAWNALGYLATAIEDVTIDINGDMIITLVGGQQVNAGTIPAGPVGADGASAYQVAVANGFVGDEAAWLASLKGDTGATGAAGSDGVAGTDGASAYEVAVANGFVGDEAAWLLSLKGDTGATGVAGSDGVAGTDGASAYEVAVANGFVGDEAAWLASLDGDDGAAGASAYQVAVANGFVGDEAAWLASLDGDDGAAGASAYQVAVANGFVGDEAAWLASLHGTDGDDGAAGLSTSPLFKTDMVAVVFLKTAAETLSIKAGTQVLKKSELIRVFATDTAVTMPSHTIGTDYYIYVCDDDSIRADANASAPTGYNTTNSRKIGGYHYGRVRNSLTVTDVATEIVPRSLWDLTYRPKCNPAGMVDVHGNGSLWADIYLAAVDSAITLTNGVVTAGTCKSIYNGTPLSGTEGLHGYNFIELAKNSGKRLLTHSEWLAVAHGSPQGNDGDNLNAWSATTNSARTGTGQVARAVSFCGACDCVGNLWEWLDEWSNDYSTAVAGNWYNPMTGQNVGQQYLYNSTGLRMYLAGGAWAVGVLAGSRALGVNIYPWNVSTYFGSRFACDGL